MRRNDEMLFVLNIVGVCPGMSKCGKQRTCVGFGGSRKKLTNWKSSGTNCRLKCKLNEGT